MKCDVLKFGKIKKERKERKKYAIKRPSGAIFIPNASVWLKHNIYVFFTIDIIEKFILIWYDDE